MEVDYFCPWSVSNKVFSDWPQHRRKHFPALRTLNGKAGLSSPGEMKSAVISEPVRTQDECDECGSDSNKCAKAEKTCLYRMLFWGEMCVLLSFFLPISKTVLRSVFFVPFPGAALSECRVSTAPRCPGSPLTSPESLLGPLGVTQEDTI